MANKKISELTDYTTPIDTDIVPIVDISNTTTKKSTWAIIKSTLETYFDTLYQAVGTYVTPTSTDNLTNKTLTSPILNLGSDAEGDTYYRNSSGVLVRLARGTDNYIMKMNGNVPNWEAETVTVNGSTTVAGISEIATSSEINNGTATGGSGAPLVVTPDGLASSRFGYAFGGNGSDGALNVISGTTTLDLTSSSYKIFNYTSINISSGATVTFSNPASGGTVIILKSQGGITIAGTLDAKGFGASGGSTASAGTSISSTLAFFSSGSTNGGAGSTGGAGAGGGALTNTSFYTLSAYQTAVKYGLFIVPGAGGGGGGNGLGTGGGGGRGGSGLLIECAGSWNFTGTINLSGNNGVNGSGNMGAGGGGGAPGTMLTIYNSLTSNSGTVVNTGGNGGDANGSGGGTPGGGGGGGGGWLGTGGAGGYTANGSSSSTGGGGGAGGDSTSRTGGTGATTNSSTYLIIQNTCY